MRLRRALWATAGGLLATWLLLACLIDRGGVTEVEASRVDTQEVLVVLGARVEPDGQPSPTLQARVEHAVELAVRRPKAVLLFSGGVGTYGASEAFVAREVAVALGVPRERCILEDESHSTSQNAAFSMRLLKARFPRGLHVTVVSDPYHLVRARMLFARQAGQAISSSPVLGAPRHQAWPSRVWWTLREVPAVVKDWFGP